MKKPIRALVFTAFCTLAASLTVAQRAFAAVAYDGREPAELEGAERERAQLIFGSVDTVPAAARQVIVQVKGRDVGGSRLGAERCAHLALTLPLDRIGAHELAYAAFIGPKLRHARIGLRHARAALKRHGVQLIEDSRDGFTIVRHDGRRVRFEAFAASRGGDTVRGVPLVAALLDEAGFFADDNGVANGEAIFAAAIPRLLPGGQILIVSSPWNESGLLYTEFHRNFGAPVTALAALCPTGIMRDDAETLAMVATERQRDPDNAAREFDAQFIGGSGFFFDGALLRAALDPSLEECLEPPPGAQSFLGGDLALYRDASALAVVHRYQGTPAAYHVAELLERKPAKDSPLDLASVVTEFAHVAKRQRAQQIVADHHLLPVANSLMPSGVRLVACPPGQEGKIEAFVSARNLFRAGLVRLPASAIGLVAQMCAVTSTPSAGGGLLIRSPRRGGTHGDVVSALVLALWRSARPAPDHRVMLITPGQAPALQFVTGSDGIRRVRV